MKHETFELKNVANTLEMVASSFKMVQIAGKVATTGNHKNTSGKNHSPNNSGHFLYCACHRRSSHVCVCVLFAHVRCEKRNSAGYCPLRWTCRSPGWSVNSRRTGRVVADCSEVCGFKTVLFSFRDWIQIFVRVIFPTIPPNLHDVYGNSKS